MQINEIHSILDFFTNKELAGYTIPAEKDAALDRASMWRFNDAWKFYAINQEAQDDLAPFKKKYSFTNNLTPAGLISLPADYLHLLNVTAISYNNQYKKRRRIGLEVVNDDEKDERIESDLIPLASHPIAVWAGKGKLQVHPELPVSGDAWYLKRPNVPKMVYTQTGRVITYDSVNSVQLEWDEANLNKIIFKALQFLGVNLSDDKAIQYATIKDSQAV